MLNNIPIDGLRIDVVSEGATASLVAEALNLPDPSANASIPTFGFTYKQGGIVVRNHTALSALVSRELIDLAVFGFNPEKINEYAAKNTALRSFTLTTATFGLGTRFDFDPRLAAESYSPARSSSRRSMSTTSCSPHRRPPWKHAAATAWGSTWA